MFCWAQAYYCPGFGGWRRRGKRVAVYYFLVQLCAAPDLVGFRHSAELLLVGAHFGVVLPPLWWVVSFFLLDSYLLAVTGIGGKASVGG